MVVKELVGGPGALKKDSNNNSEPFRSYFKHRSSSGAKFALQTTLFLREILSSLALGLSDRKLLC